MKQTAVEWLVEQLTYKTSVGVYTTDGTDDVTELVQQAKQMEKMQIIKFGKIVADKWGMIPAPLENIEDIYNKTYEGKDN